MQWYEAPVLLFLLEELGALYQISLSDESKALYWETLKPFDWRAVQEAFEASIGDDSENDFPNPQDLVKRIECSIEIQALQAWGKVERALYQIGAYQSVVFDDPLIHVTLETMGGWVKLCSMTLDEMPVHSNTFQKFYKTLLKHRPLSYPKYLCGMAEIHNKADGYPITPPVLVGDPVAAKQILLMGIQESSQTRFSTDFTDEKDEHETD